MSYNLVNSLRKPVMENESLNCMALAIGQRQHVDQFATCCRCATTFTLIKGRNLTRNNALSSLCINTVVIFAVGMFSDEKLGFFYETRNHKISSDNFICISFKAVD